MNDYKDKLNAIVWIAHTLFEKGLVSGSTGNISFLHEDIMYISSSGSCFGRLQEDNFAILDLKGNILKGKPSKEYPIHLALYKINKDNQVVIHTHSIYSTIFSCRKNMEEKIHELFIYTPYLEMLSGGKIISVNYEKPGSVELFDEFKRKVNQTTNVYILKNHGVIVSSHNIYNAFNMLEEFEVTCKIHHHLQGYDQSTLHHIT